MKNQKKEESLNKLSESLQKPPQAYMNQADVWKISKHLRNVVLCRFPLYFQRNASAAEAYVGKQQLCVIGVYVELPAV